MGQGETFWSKSQGSVNGRGVEKLGPKAKAEAEATIDQGPRTAQAKAEAEVTIDQGRRTTQAKAEAKVTIDQGRRTINSTSKTSPAYAVRCNGENSACRLLLSFVLDVASPFAEASTSAKAPADRTGGQANLRSEIRKTRPTTASGQPNNQK
jgi:hypothetical protein